jgi:hypothetical protein
MTIDDLIKIDLSKVAMVELDYNDDGEVIASGIYFDNVEMKQIATEVKGSKLVVKCDDLIVVHHIYSWALELARDSGLSDDEIYRRRELNRWLTELDNVIADWRDAYAATDEEAA